MCAKNYENWLAVDKVIAKMIRLTFLAHHVSLVHIKVAFCQELPDAIGQLKKLSSLSADMNRICTLTREVYLIIAWFL